MAEEILNLVLVLSNFAVAMTAIILAYCTFKACDENTQRTIRSIIRLHLNNRKD